jgi:hypothetical protein
MDMEKILRLRIMVRGAYDLQNLRIQMGNRLVANFKSRLGQKAGESEKALEKEAKEILDKLRAAYKRITDAAGGFPKHKKFEGDIVISTYTEACLIDSYFKLLADEEEQMERLKHIVPEFPIYNAFLKDVYGIAHTLSGVLIASIDITKAKYASSLWKYAGLDVGPDGTGRSRKAVHLVKRKYTDKRGVEQERDSITFNPFLKTKLLGVLAPSFLRCGAVKSKYAAAYYDYKNRLENHVKYGIANDKVKDEAGHFVTGVGRRHNMAMRRMVKLFLIDLYAAWRAVENLPVHPPYSEAKLGFNHGEDAKSA